MQLQVENTARCCAAVSRGEVDVAVVGGQIPANLEHLLQARPPSLKKHAIRVISGVLIHAHHRMGPEICFSPSHELTTLV